MRKVHPCPGQLAFGFFKGEIASSIKRGKIAAKKRKKRKLSQILRDLMDTDCVNIDPEIEARLDALIRARKAEVQAKWDAAREADAKGMDWRSIRMKTMHIEHDGRLHYPVVMSSSSCPELEEVDSDFGDGF